jgi:hypothetical protein
MFQTKVVEKKTHILCQLIPSPENRAVYEIMWKKQGTATNGSVIRRVIFEWWLPKFAETDTEYCNTAFPRQQWLLERASILSLYVRCLSCY